MVFVLFLLDDGWIQNRIRIRKNNDGFGSWRSKNIPYGFYESGSTTLENEKMAKFVKLFQNNAPYINKLAYIKQCYFENFFY
jgi:hypothetical protein